MLAGPNLGVYAVNHSLVADERVNGACAGAPMLIGDRCWLGSDEITLVSLAGFKPPPQRLLPFSELPAHDTMKPA